MGMAFLRFLLVEILGDDKLTDFDDRTIAHHMRPTLPAVAGKTRPLFDQHPRRLLGQPEHRVTFYFTPRHASWLNQIEIWFSILMRKLLRRGNFASKNALRTKIEEFIAYFNRTMAKPFRWTMDAKPLAG